MRLRALWKANVSLGSNLAIILAVIIFAGFADAAFLAIEHYRGVVPPCSVLSGCEIVTTSRYSVMFGVPLALLGAIHYLVELVLVLAYLDTRRSVVLLMLSVLVTIGALASLGFVYLQLGVLGAICLYCMFSAAVSFVAFALLIPTVRSYLRYEA